MSGESLREYNRKRDFEHTSEPRGAKTKPSADKTFVVQRHHASTLHFDFRLEVDGVLKSWAVPKGLPTEPGVRRLAVQTEDHPLAYATFEGSIPNGQYGAGKVKIWDSGEYQNLRAKSEGLSMAESLAEGKLEIALSGKELEGAYAVIRTDDAEGHWIILKMKSHEPERVVK